MSGAPRPIRVAIIGTGRMGSALAAQLAAAGHQVRVGSRDRDRGRQQAAAAGAAFGGTYRTAAAGADVVVLAVPWEAVPETLASIGHLDHAVLVDVTNPFGERAPAGRGGAPRSSGAERIQELVPGVPVVKAWNHIYSAVIRRSADFDGVAATAFVAGDDALAKELVASLVRDVGFEAVDAGPLASARYLEPLAALMTTLDGLAGGELHHGLKLLRRARRAHRRERLPVTTGTAEYH
jgi:NADPH-dependent F420 reductase